MLVFPHLLTYTWDSFYKFIPDMDCTHGPLQTPFPLEWRHNMQITAWTSGTGA